MTSYIRSIILGGIDGVITSFAVVAGASVTQRASNTVLIVGSSSILADGVSMGVSEFLSTTSAQNVDNGKTELEQKKVRPWIMGVVCFCSFVLCGAVQSEVAGDLGLPPQCTLTGAPPASHPAPTLECGR